MKTHKIRVTGLPLDSWPEKVSLMIKADTREEALIEAAAQVQDMISDGTMPKEATIR